MSAGTAQGDPSSRRPRGVGSKRYGRHEGEEKSKERTTEEHSGKKMLSSGEGEGEEEEEEEEEGEEDVVDGVDGGLLRERDDPTGGE
jgi:hypothetical protein